VRHAIILSPHRIPGLGICHRDTNTSLTELKTSTLESERQKWQRESKMRHAPDLETLAADLHTQYREKHTRKVEALKLTYKRQYEKKDFRFGGSMRELGSWRGRSRD
jgi:hypothetical protein